MSAGGYRTPGPGTIAGTMGGATVIAMAMALATPDIMHWEGKRNDPYRDIVGVLTVCHGDTHAPMRHHTDAECAAMLARRLETDQAPALIRCVPGFAARPYPFAAALSLSYNIGSRAFCASTTARHFRAGDWRGGCDAMRRWNRAGGRVVSGLVRRREAEWRLCLTGGD